MSVQPTFRFITDQAIEDSCADLLPVFEQVKRDFRQSVACPNGFTVLPRINAQGLTPLQLRDECLAVQCDYNIFIGDSVAWIYQVYDLYGHGAIFVPASGYFLLPGALALDATNSVTQIPPGNPTGRFSRVYYKSQSEDPETSIALYRKWLLKVISAAQTEMIYAPEVWVDDHFNYDPYTGIGDSARAQIPAAMLRDKRGLGVIDTGSSRTDGEWEALATRPVLMNVNLDGGFQPGLYNTGYSADWLRINPGAYLQVAFGSFQGQFQWDQNLPMASTTTDMCDTCVITWYGRSPIGKFLRGFPAGDIQAGMADTGFQCFDAVAGDCSKMVTDNQLALTQMASRVTTLESGLSQAQTDIANIKANGTVNSNPPTNLLAGATVTSSSTQSGFSAQSVINGSHTQYGGGLAWAPVGNAGWLQFDLPRPVSASKVTVYTCQDNYQAQIEPSDTMTFTKYGLISWLYEGWDGTAWHQLATISGNNLVKKSQAFQTFTGQRFKFTPLSSPDGGLRLVQIEMS